MSREMKHSGIEWIGEIPKEWKIGKVKNYYSLQTGFTPDTKNELYYDDENGYLWVNISDIGNSHYINSTKKKISQYYISKYNPTIVPKGSLLYSFKLSVGSVAIADVELYTNEAIASFLQGENVNLNFLFYSSQICIIHNANENIYGAKLLNQDLINNATIVFPPLSEQQKIANYLDKVCGEVDKMISLQEQMIEELKAYKQSVITEAVTKGLIPNVPMKDSGIDWIGEVPEGWKVCKLKNVYQLLNGRAYLDPELLEEGKYRILRVGNLFSSDKWYYSDMELEDNKYCQSGDLLYGWSASIGPYIWEGEKVIYHYHIWKVLFSNNNLHFSYYLLYALTLAKQRDMHGSAMQHLTKTNMDNSFIALPPLSEQQSIASYLDTKCTEIDALIAIMQAKIDELKEYKKSVIYEYVTGKKEVV